MKLNKEHVAVRQLDTAISLMFNGGDIVSVHTLACASSTIFRDLVRTSGETSWRDHIVKCHPGREKEVNRVLNDAQNFFKHADNDPNVELEFEEITNDATIEIAIREYDLLLSLRNIGEKLTIPMSIFDMWYFAKKPEPLLLSPEGQGKNFVYQAQSLFPNLNNHSRVKQLAMATEVLNREVANI